MTFSCKVKEELCYLKNEAEDEVYEIYGILSYAKIFSESSENILKTENGLLCNKISEILSERFGVITETICRKNFSSDLYILNVPINEDRIRILKKFKGLDYKTFNQKALSLFLRGIFLVCGNLAEPSLGYHLEFSVLNEEKVEHLKEILSGLGLELHVNCVYKRNRFVVYMKSFDNIMDFLTFIGATASVMELVQVKMLKEARNQINRTNNFETANINKTVVAATEQILAIKEIEKKIGLNSLPGELKELALLRLKNPQASLKELGESLMPKLSRSGVNHRMNKLMHFIK